MEKLMAYALRIDGVHVVDGRSENHAIRRALECGLMPHSRAIYEQDSDGHYRVEWGGFRTSNGRYVKGAEAVEIARRSGQLRRSSWQYRIRELHGVVPIRLGHRVDKHVLSTRDVKNLDASTLSEIEGPIRGKIEGGQPVDRWQIVSRAIRWGNSRGDVFITEKDSFTNSGWVIEDEGGEVPLLAIEGYVLDNGEFITREEAKLIFPATDIHWEKAESSEYSEHPQLCS